MKDPIQDITQRTRQYWFSDGFPEIIGGGFFALLGLYFALQVWLPEASLLRVVVDASFILTIVLSGFAARWLINRLKERLTYPRTGFVAYPAKRSRSPFQRVLVALTGMVISIVITTMFVNWTASRTWMPAISGALLGVITLLFIAPRIGILRFYAYAGLAPLVGLGISLAGLDEIGGLALFYGVCGGGMLLAGLLVLALYLRRTSRASLEQD